MEEGDGPAFGDRQVELDDEQLEDEVVGLEMDDMLAETASPDFVDEETRTLSAGLSSQDEGELLAALEAMQKAVTRPDGDNVLVAYVLASSQCAELMRIWQAGPGAVTAVPVMLLLYYMMGQSFREIGSDDRESHRKVVAVKLRLDKVARSIVRLGMKDIYSHLSSTQKSRQNAALLLLSAIVLRGRALAIEIATSFDFTLEALRKLGYPPKVGTQKYRVEGSRGILKQPTRVAFVEFAMSFLSVGDPGLLRWILQKRPLWIGVLHGISKDDEATIVRVLTLMKEKVMSPAYMVPRGLQSVLFGDATLEQLARISSDDSLSGAGEIAHATLLSLCTDPSHGLCPENSELWDLSSSSKSGAFGGGQGRLLRLLVRLRVAEVDRHKDLLLATAKTRPRLASLYLASIPLSLEPRVSPAWFNAMSLVSELIPIASQLLSVSSMAARSLTAPTVDAPLIQNILLSLLPIPLSRVVLNRGLLHADVMVNHACLRLLLEALLSLRGILKAIDAAICDEPLQGTCMVNGGGDRSLVAELEDCSRKQDWMKLSQSMQDIMRASLPDPNTLVAMLSTLNASHRSGGKVILSPGKQNSPARKKRKRNEPEDNNGTTTFQVSTSDKYEYNELIMQLWGPQIMEDGLNVEADGLLHSKIVQVLAAYQAALPIAMADSGFDAFKLLPDNPASLSVAQQKSLSSLLLETTGPTPLHCVVESGGFNVSFAGLVSACKKFRSLLLLILHSDLKEVRDSLYLTAQRVMLSTGAFDSNPKEISLWLDFLLQWRSKEFSLSQSSEGITHLVDRHTGTLDASLVDFLCEAISDIGQNIYKYLDQLHSILAKYTLLEGSGLGGGGPQGVIAPEFSPFVVCVLEHCIQVMQSNTGGTIKCSAVVLYVANVLDLLLKYQVNPQSLAVIVLTLLSAENELLSTLHPECSEWTAVLVVFQRAQLLLLNDGMICPSSFRLSIVGSQAADYEVGKLAEVLKSCHEDQEEAVEARKSFLISTLVNTSVKELVGNFPLLMRVCLEDFGGDFSLITPLLGIHEDLLSEVSIAWPQVFTESVEQAAIVKYTSEGKGKQNASTIKLVPSYLVAETSGLCILLLTTPFPILFAAASSGKGLLLTSQPFSDLLHRSLQREHYQSWIPALRLIISRMKNVVTSCLEGIDVDLSVRTCFSLIFSVVLPIQPGQGYSFLSETILCLPNNISVYESVIDLLYHPQLYNLFLHSVWTPCPSSLPSLCAGGSTRHNEDKKIWDASLRRVLSSAANIAHPLDHHILSLLTRVLEFSQYTVEMALSSSKAVDLDFCKKVLFGCKPFILKAVSTFQKEVDESSRHGVAASPALLAVSEMISYAEPSLLLGIFLSLLSTNPVKLKTSKQIVAPHILGLHFVTVFVNSLAGGGQRFMLKGDQSQAGMEDWKPANNLDIHLIYDLYEKVVDQVTRNPSLMADLCLLSFLQSPELSQSCWRGFDVPNMCHTSLPSFIHSTPLQVLRHCVSHANKVTGKICVLLVERSQLHLAELGRLLVLGTVDRRRCELGDRGQQFAEIFQTHDVPNQKMDLVLSDENLLALLPAAEVYIACEHSKADAKENKGAHHIAAVYGKLLTKKIKKWDKLVSAEIVVAGVQDANLPTSALLSENDLYFTLKKHYISSPLGQIANMLQMCHVLCPLGLKIQNRLFESLLPNSDFPLVGQNMLLSAGEDISRFVFEAIAKTTIVRNFLFLGFRLQAEFSSSATKPKHEKEMLPEDPAGKNSPAALQKFLGALTSTLAMLYRCEAIEQKKIVGVVLPQTHSQKCKAHWLNFLEETILVQIMDVAKELSSLSLDIPKYVPLFRSSMTTLLGYRYGNTSAMKACRYLTFVLFQGLQYQTLGVENLVESDVLELLIGHSKFLPSLLVMDSKRMHIPHISGKHAGRGTALASLPSILALGGSPPLLPSRMEKESANYQASTKNMTSGLKKIFSSGGKEGSEVSLQGDKSEDSSSLDESKRLELVKLLRILLGVTVKRVSVGTVEVQSVPLDEILSVLLAAYGGTMSVVDQEIFLLMQEIESYGGLGFSGLPGLDYLWGEAALKRRRGKAEHAALNTQEPESIDELRRHTFKQDLLIDPRRCGLAVLFFPVERQFGAADIGQSELVSQYKESIKGVPEHSVMCATQADLRAAAYDPAFLLPFALHGLSIGCINAEEFVRLGLLAIALASICSAEESMRKAGYEVLAKYFSVLEDGPSFKGRLQIRLLMTFVKNAVTEPWQRLPTVYGVFAAEASCILMHPENYLYMTINRYLLRAPSLDVENIPLFQVMFGSGSVQYRSDRLWMIRLLAAGLRSPLDASVYRRKFVLELLMSFHDSAMADTFSRKWVLQVLYQAATVRSFAQYLVECSGLFSWLVSVAVKDIEGDLGLQDDGGSGQLASMALQVIQCIMSWGSVRRHFHLDNMEELSKAGHVFYKFLVKNWTPQSRDMFQRSTIRIMLTLVRSSQKRRRHQTHFTLNLRGLLEAINWVRNEVPYANKLPVSLMEDRQLTLQLALHTSPPLVKSTEDKVQLFKVVSWALSVSLQLESDGVEKSSNVDSCHQLKCGSQAQESLLQKLLRWLAASVILGEVSNGLSKTHSGHKFIKCFSVVNGFNNAELVERNSSSREIDEQLARLLLKLEGHASNTFGRMSLFPVVTALVILTRFLWTSKSTDHSTVKVARCKLYSVLELLLSELPCPVETNSSWLWSFNSPWEVKDVPVVSNIASSVQAQFESELCRTLVIVLQQFLSRRETQYSSLLSLWETILSEKIQIDNDPIRNLVYKKLSILQVKLHDALQEKCISLLEE